MAGRPKTPKALKIVQGTYRKDQDHNEIQVDAGIPDCPKWLNASGKKYWSEIAPILEQNNLLSVCDLSTFSLHCDSMGLFIEIAERIESVDELMTITPQGFEVQGVLIQIRNKLWDQVVKSGAAFGHSPQSRSSIKAEPKTEKKVNSFDGI
jgi:P27 family predicted phage terminase small subunit